MSKMREYPFSIICRSSVIDIVAGGRTEIDGKATVVTVIKSVKALTGGYVEVRGWHQIFDK